MNNIVEQMKVEQLKCEKAQEEQEIVRKRQMSSAAVQIQTLFRGYWYDNFAQQLHRYTPVF